MRRLIHRHLFRQVDASSLAVFRIMFGALILFESINYSIFLCLDCAYRDTEFLFKFHHFEWVMLWPGYGLEINYAVMALAAIGVMLGLFYRLADVVLSITFAYIFLLDQALYLNHYYLAILFSVILIFVPAHRLWSVDAIRRPGIGSLSVPNWGRFWLGAQLEIVLVYAGIAKLNPDWLNLEPMRLWMNELSQDAGPFYQWATQDWGIATASYSVIVLHLIGAPLLLYRPTRWAVFGMYALFHIVNSLVFNIGIFPWMTFAATLMLFDADWPRQFLPWLHYDKTPRIAEPQRDKPQDTTSHVAGSSVSSLAKDRRKYFVQFGLILLIGGWLAIQVLVPLRHWVAPGNVAWNEDGHRFSWRMKLRSKRGSARFIVIRQDGQRWSIDPFDHLNARQARKMACIPDLIWQFAQFLEAKYDDNGASDVQVYAEALCSLNTREPAALINRLIDLTAIPRTEPVKNWVLSLRKPLPQYVF